MPKTKKTLQREREERELVAARLKVARSRNAMNPRSGSHGVFEEVTETKEPIPYKAMTGFAKLTWRFRWYLTPLLLSAILFGLAAINPSYAMFLSLALAMVGIISSTRTPEKPKLMSIKERQLLATYGITGAVWACFTGWLVTSWVSLGLLVLLTAYPTYKWMKSRKIRKKMVSNKSKEFMKKWTRLVASQVGPLQNSEIVLGTMTEPSPGSMSFGVRLAHVHGEDAANTTVRKFLEMVLNLGIGTVQVQADRESANHIKVTITPDRHLEKNNAEWLDPIVHADGTIDLALAPDGENIQVALHNEHGVEHSAIAGTTGSGKSNTVVTMVLPGVLSGHEVLWYADGGRGSSVGHLKKACDWTAFDVDDWDTMLRSAVAVCKDRHRRRAALDLDEWRGFAEPDPVLTLVCDEASLMLPEIYKKAGEDMLWLLKNGRKVGVRVIQITQDPMSDEWIGGRKARGLMAGGGSMIAHRPGDGTAAMLSLGSSSKKIDLVGLPPGEGWAAIIRRNQIVAEKARVRYASKQRVAEAIEKAGELRTLSGDDWIAAGPAYQDRKVNQKPVKQHSEVIVSGSSATPSASNAERILAGAAASSVAISRANKNAILRAITAYGAEGIEMKDLIDNTKRGKTTVYNAVRELKSEEKVTKGSDGKLRLVEYANA